MNKFSRKLFRKGDRPELVRQLSEKGFFFFTADVVEKVGLIRGARLAQWISARLPPL